MSFSYEYARPAVTVDCVVFGVDLEADALEVLLVRRGEAPFRGALALPGGFVREHEALEAAARRELREETAAEVDYLEQLATFGDKGRDPRGHVISVAYIALTRSRTHAVEGGSDARTAAWYAARRPPGSPRLAFDHDEILAAALARLTGKVRYAPIGFNLLPPTFTLSQLQRLYEVVLGRELDKRNFRKRIAAMEILSPAGKQEGVSHRAATLYRFDRRAYDRATRSGWNFDL